MKTNIIRIDQLADSYVDYPKDREYICSGDILLDTYENIKIIIEELSEKETYHIDLSIILTGTLVAPSFHTHSVTGELIPLTRRIIIIPLAKDTDAIFTPIRFKYIDNLEDIFRGSSLTDKLKYSRFKHQEEIN